MNIRLKQAISALLCVGTLLTVTSCAETPTEDIVVNKGDSDFEAKIENSEGTPLELKRADDGTVRETTSFTSDNGAVTFNIDANVTVPDVTKVPAVEVTPKFLSSDEARRIAETLIGTDEFYEYSEVFTKDELQTMILEKKREINDRDALLEYYGSEETVEWRIAQLEEEIAAIEADMENAPDVYEVKASDFEYHDADYYQAENVTGYMVSRAGRDKTIMATAEAKDVPYLIQVGMKDKDGHKSSQLYLEINKQTEMERYAYFQTTPFTEAERQEAAELAKRILAEMDDNEWSIGKVSEMELKRDEQAYYEMIFECVPAYNEVALMIEQPLTSFEADEGYLPAYHPTKVQLRISSGYVTSFTYQSPLEIVNVSNENVEIMSYDAALKRIYDQLEITFTAGSLKEEQYGESQWSSYDIEITKAQVTVDRMNLVMIRTEKKDDMENYYLIPAWVVYGDSEVLEMKIDGKTSSNTGGRWVSDDYETPVLLIINAIDGSVIDTYFNHR